MTLRPAPVGKSPRGVSSDPRGLFGCLDDESANPASRQLIEYGRVVEAVWTAADIKTWSDVASSLAQVLAIVVGGGWALWKFGLHREEWPRATVEQAITRQSLDDQHLLLRVLVTVKNAGSVLIDMEEVRVDVSRVRPLAAETKKALESGTLVPADEAEATWPFIDSRKRLWEPGEAGIEPGEGEPFGFDFVLPGDLEMVLVYCYVRNVKQRERPIGWSLTQFYDLKDGDAQPKTREAMAGRA
jgi:hypothetical protein